MSFALELPLEGSRARIVPGDGPATIIRLSDGAAAGCLDLEADGAALFVRALVIDPAYRSYGLGSEVARLVREAAERGAWQTLRAWAPPDAGLAVYFWSRMGLRPLHGDGPGGGISFERTV